MRADGTKGSQGRWYAVRGYARALACALAATSALLLVASSPASALLQRGHEFSQALSFGKAGSGGTEGAEPEFKEPSGVAVNEATGAIYVLDAGNNRVVQVDAAHHFVAAWGWGVTDGVTKAFQVCKKECHAGLPGKGKGQFHTTGAIAVDNSNGVSKGDVYVEAIQPFEEVIGNKEVEAEVGSIDKFGPSGELLDAIKSYKEPGGGHEVIEEPHGITVAANGDLWITNEEYLIDIGGEVKNKTIELVESEANGEPRPGIAVDPVAGGLGGFYVGHENATPGSPTVVAKEKVLEELSGLGEKSSSASRRSKRSTRKTRRASRRNSSPATCSSTTAPASWSTTAPQKRCRASARETSPPAPAWSWTGKPKPCSSRTRERGVSPPSLRNPQGRP